MTHDELVAELEALKKRVAELERKLGLPPAPQPFSGPGEER